MTTDANPTTIATIPIPNNRVYEIDATFFMNNQAGNTAGKFRRTVTAANIAGTVQIVGPIDTIGSDGPIATTVVNAVPQGTNLLLQVTGESSTNYWWGVTYTLRQYTITTS